MDKYNTENTIKRISRYNIHMKAKWVVTINGIKQKATMMTWGDADKKAKQMKLKLVQFLSN